MKKNIAKTILNNNNKIDKIKLHLIQIIFCEACVSNVYSYPHRARAHPGRPGKSS